MRIGPLHPLTYFRRNLGRALPISFVIMLAVALVAGVVSIVHSIDLTVFTLYGYSRYLTGLTPRNALEIDSQQLKRVQSLPDAGYLFPTHSYNLMVKTIFGKMPLPLFGLSASGRAMILQRAHIHLAAGRMPAHGATEAVLSTAVARNIGAHIGSIIAGPSSQDDYAPEPIRLVGLLDGPVWLGLTSRSMVDRLSPFTFTGCMVFARSADPAAQRRVDREVSAVLDKGQTREWTYSYLVREEKSALSNLYLILHIVVGIIVFSIAFMCGLLANIYYTQRLPEIATLSAIGYSRSRLLWRAVGETAILTSVGWLLGVAGTVGMLALLLDLELRPRGLLLNIMDPGAFTFTLPLPAAILLFALLTIGVRLRTLDPVGIIERRG